MPRHARILVKLTCKECGFVRLQHPASFKGKPESESGGAANGGIGLPTEEADE